MEFLRERVYTSLNADELKQGDKVIVADDIFSLRAWVESGSNAVTSYLLKIQDDEHPYRFQINDGSTYLLAYLVERAEPKAEPKTEKHYRPFRDTDELIKVWLEKGGKWQKRELTMPHIWVRGKISKNTNTGWLVTGIGYDGVALGDTSLSWEELFEDWEFLDGSPCGVEE